jgi:nucleotide-binding universal stress UspA family protein
MFNNILIPVDGSPISMKAARAGITLARAAERAGVRCQTVVEVARPDKGIVAMARKRKCDAIFIASHGLRGIKRLLLGSVTSRVLANAEIPVIVYR